MNEETPKEEPPKEEPPKEEPLEEEAPKKIRRFRKRGGGVTPVWASLGWRAFVRSFWCGRFGCDGGGRDFAWLTLLLGLVMAMALLGAGSRAGFLDRLAETLLGDLKPYGAPVWITAHWENHEGIHSGLLEGLGALENPNPGGGEAASPAGVPEINGMVEAPGGTATIRTAGLTGLLDRIGTFGLGGLGGLAAEAAAPEVSVHPYRRLDQGRPSVSLPAHAAWLDNSGLVGWAVYPSDPLWRMALAESRGLAAAPDESSPWLGLPLEVALNEALFTRFFDYDAYREAINPHLSEHRRLGPLPAGDPGALRRQLDTLWMMVTVSQEERLIPFHIHWVRHIPAMEQVGFLFPLTTYNALLAAYHLPDLRYRPEYRGRGDSAEAHRALMRSDYPRRDLVAFIRCIQEEVAATGLTEGVTVSRDRCPPPAVHPTNVVAEEARRWRGQWDTLNHDRDNQLWIPCHRLSRVNPVRESLCPDLDDDASGAAFVPWDVTRYGSPFTAARVYVPSARDLGRIVEQVRQLRVPEGGHAFNIHPMYQDALNRFNLLSDLLEALIPAYAMVFIALLTALLAAQIGGVIDRRRNHFGILMSRGFTWRAIYAKMLFQVTAAGAFSAALAIGGVVTGLRWFLERGFGAVLERHRELLPPNHGLEVMPLPWPVIGVSLGGVLFMVLLVTVILLARIPLTPGTTPSDLLHGNMRRDPGPVSD